MLQNYLRIAWRTLRKRVGPTLINVVSLAVGLAACLLIGLWVEHELSYDDFHPAAERIYRVALDLKLQDNEQTQASTAAPLASVLVSESPWVETATHLHVRSNIVHVDNQVFPDHQVAWADASFFDVFGGFQLLHGSRETALDDTDAVVLTASTAERLYGRRDVVGETLEIGGETRRITGVLADVPETSHLQFAAVGRLTLDPQMQDAWLLHNWNTYVKLVPVASKEAFEATLSDVVQLHVAPRIKEIFGTSYDQMAQEGARYRLFAQPLTEIYLHSDLDFETAPGGSMASVYIFSAIALFILLIACINFVNLATARASERATEVGMRKALGASRQQLAGQFLGEALLTTAAATVVALGLAALALPGFNGAAGTSLKIEQVLQPSILLGGLVLVIVVGLLSGSYPAFALPRLAPATVLTSRGRRGTGGAGTQLRQGLVVFQFALSIVLIAGTLVAQKQFSFIQDKRLGLEKEHVVAIERAATLQDRQSAFVERIRLLPGVAAAGASDGVFEDVNNQVFVPDQAPDDESRTINYMQVGYGFVDAMGVDVVAGRTFDPGRPADSSTALVNRAAVEALGWEKQQGHRLRAPGEGGETYEVIGVVDDFHYQSLRRQVEPLVLYPDDVMDRVYVRLDAGRTRATLDRLRAAWNEVSAQDPLQYSFLDQTYAQLHRDTRRTGQLFTIFAVLAVVIACLGLFGLATYTVQRRAKEIGIRKALGATVTQVVGLLSKEFLLLVAIAFVVAMPVAYLVMQRWLQDFAYRVDLGIGIFVLAGVLAFAVALLTVSSQAFRAAQLDPATTLRDE